MRRARRSPTSVDRDEDAPGAVTTSGADTRVREPDDVDMLDELTTLQAVRLGMPLVALGAIGGSLLATIFGSEGGGDSVDVLAVALVLAAAVPWVLWLVGVEQSTWRFAMLALAPPAALDVLGWFDVGLGNRISYQLGFFPLLMLGTMVVVACPPREAGIVATGVYLVVMGGLLVESTDIDEIDVTGIVSWHAGFVFSLCAGWSVRQGTLAMARERQAREALAWQAAGNERRRIARDVHDVVAHTLAVSMLHMTAARMAVRRSDPDSAVEALEEAERHGRTSLSDIRRIVRLLRSEDDRALESAQPGLDDIVELVDGYCAAGVPVELTIRGDLDDISATSGLALYRICQEALTNAARHGTGPAVVDLAVDDGRVALQVRNAVDPVRASAPNDPDTGTRGVGSGLLGMHERVAAAGGTLVVGPRNGQWVLEACLAHNAATQAAGSERLPSPEPPGPPFPPREAVR